MLYAMEREWLPIYKLDWRTHRRLSFRLDQVVLIETVGLAMQSAVEHVSVGSDGTPRGAAICTNVFMRTPSGWRMVMHHASPAPTVPSTEPKGPLH